MNNEFDAAASSMDESEVLQDPFLYAAGAAENEKGLDCEIKTYDARYNSKGERMFLQVGKKKECPDVQDRDLSSALVLTRFYTPEMELYLSELRVQSPHMRKALRETITDYPGISLTASTIVIHDSPACVFHYRKELAQYARATGDQDAREHVEFLLSYASRVFQRSIASFSNLMETPSSAPGLEYQDLWMAFRPGDLIYTKLGTCHKVMKFRSMSLRKPSLCSLTKEWFAKGEVINYDGREFGHIESVERIRPYENWVPLKDLPVFPLEYHPDKDSITDTVLDRGRKFVGLHGVHHMYYDGVVDALSPSRRNTVFGEEDEFPTQSMSIKGRVMIDCKMFERVRPSHSLYFEMSSKTYKVNEGEHLQLQDEDLMICSHSISGYSLSAKRWCYFEVTELREIEFNADAFDKLILPPKQKDMVLSLVRIHADDRLSFDDVIRGKGKGMVFLLHGAAGVGKTLTAESVADYTRRPLYVVGCGDLGLEAPSVEEALSSILQLSLAWNAILLLDEADVFLEQRTSNDLERNGLVSVFLRMLEYFEGILFLTSNRIRNIDRAFKSRIHLAIHYPALSYESRRELWRTFIARGTAGLEFWWGEEYLDHLAGHKLNGRQIKNAVHTAYALAASEGQDLSFGHIRMSLEAIMAFDVEMGDDLVET